MTSPYLFYLPLYFRLEPVSAGTNAQFNITAQSCGLHSFFRTCEWFAHFIVQCLIKNSLITLWQRNTRRTPLHQLERLKLKLNYYQSRQTTEARARWLLRQLARLSPSSSSPLALTLRAWFKMRASRLRELKYIIERMLAKLSRQFDCKLADGFLGPSIINWLVLFG